MCTGKVEIMTDNNDSDFSMIEKLSGSENFDIWKFQITVCFKAHGQWEIVSGELKYEDLTKDQEKSDWKRKDARAQKVIITSIEKKQLMHILNCDTSQKMFSKLCDIYQKDNDQQTCTLLQDFYNFTYEKEGDMSSHISNLENLAFRLKALNQDINDTMLMSKILTTLPADYKHFCTAWDSAAKSERTLTNLTSRLLAEETRIKTSSEKEVSVAFKATENKNKNYKYPERKCYKCGKTNHYAKDCFSKKPMCRICKKTNHSEENCFYRKKEDMPSGSRQRNNNTNNDRRVAFLVDRCEESDESQDFEFVVDSGASSHMANDVNLFSTLEDKRGEIKVAKKNETMVAEGKGKIMSEKCILNNVTYIPDLSRNLLSVNEITNKGGEVKFTKEEVIITKENEEILKGTKQRNGLYIVNLQENEEQSLLSAREIKIKNCHKKLAHLSGPNMKKLIDLSTGLDVRKCDFEDFEKCETCLESKQTRIPFKSIRKRASRTLEIIHSDLCGPIDPPTWDNKKYILTFIDDYTHKVIIYLLENKNETVGYFKEYVAEMEANKNLKVAHLRCDNGGEYINTELTKFCKEKGIVLQKTIPHTPQLNGKSERLNRTLLEKTRALLFDSGLEKKFWGEAARTAAYLMNRCPTQALENKTPYEMWNNEKPDLSRLQIFGCTANAKELGYLKKLDARSKKYIFVGYAVNGYRLFSEEKETIKICRDVVFKDVIRSNKETNNMVKITTPYDEDREDNVEEIQNDANIEESENESEVNSLDITYEDAQDDEDEPEINVLELREGRPPGRREVRLPPRYDDYVLMTYEEVLKSPEKEEWKRAISEEKKSLDRNHTWDLVNKEEAKGHKVLTSKWVFRVKSDGSYKARLVIRGCQQKYGIDYMETFSPVVNISALRVLFAISALKNFEIKKFDIKTAFLYGDLNEKVFMKIPDGYEQIENKVCQLQKSLYGLKQAPLQWNKRFTSFLNDCGLTPLQTEKCIFRNEEGTLFLGIYVDDGILFFDKKMKRKQKTC